MHELLTLLPGLAEPGTPWHLAGLPESILEIPTGSVAEVDRPAQSSPTGTGHPYHPRTWSPPIMGYG